jgi:hypothetical protein
VEAFVKQTSRTIVIVAVATIFNVTSAVAIPLTPDTFEDGTTQGWVVNLLGSGSHPAPPENVDTGGPLGVDDNFLLLTAVGGTGNGSRLSAINGSQWADDYIAAGVTALTMDVNNFGPDDLFLRLAFEDPIPGPPANIAFSSDPIFLEAGTGWTTVTFPVGVGFLTAGLGDVETALHNTTLIRIYSSEADNFPNPVSPIDSVTVQLGVDNITAVTSVTAIPEPATLLLVGSGMWAAAAIRRGRRRRTRRVAS